MITFTELEARNFLSLKEIKVPLQKQGLTLVLGQNKDSVDSDSNGSGKSAIFDALSWCLFGKTLRGVESNDVINRFVNKDCFAKIHLLKDKIEYTIQRTRKDKELGNSLSLIINQGEVVNDISALTMPDTQEKIEKLLGLDFLTFKNTVLFGQDSIKFASSSNAEQKRLFEHIMGFEVLEKAQKLANKDFSNLSELVNQTIVEMNSMKSYLERYKIDLKDTITDMKQFAVEKAEKLVKIVSKIKDINNKLSELGTPDTDTSLTNEKMKKIQNDISKNQKYITELQNLLIESTANVRLAEHDIILKQQSIEANKDEITKCQQAIGSTCPTCNQLVTKDASKTLRISLELNIKQLEIDIEKSKQSVLDVSEDHKITKALIKDLDEKNKSLETHRKDLMADLDSLRKLLQEENRLKIEMGSLKTAEEQIIESRNPYEVNVRHLRETIERQEKDIKERKKHADELEEKGKIYEFWGKGFGLSGLRSLILDSITPILNERTNYYSSRLTGSTINVRFETTQVLKSGETREKFQVLIENRAGASIYNGNSSGERQRIDISIALALQDLARMNSKVKFNLLVWDEVFEHLDEAGCEAVVLLLNEISKNFESCFVITHLEDLKNYFYKHLSVVKENGISSIVKD